MSRFRYFAPLLYIWVTSQVFAQTTTVSGFVFQKDNHQPAMINVVFLEDINAAAATDSLGRFKVSTKKNVTSIKLFGMGYDTLILPIEFNKITADLLIEVEENGIVGKEYTVKYKGDPAEMLIDSVVANRNQTDFKRAGSFFASDYEKTTLSLFNVSTRFMTKSFLTKAIRPIFSNPDTVNGIVMYPALISEIKADKYKKHGQLESKYIKASQISGFKEDEFGLATMGSKLFSDFNIYDDYQNIIGKPVMGPINPIGKTYYKYAVVDTTTIDQHTCYQIMLKPRLFSETIYSGSIWVSDTTYAVLKADLLLDSNAKINLIHDFEVKLLYKKMNDSSTYFILEKETTRLDVDPLDILDFRLGISKKSGNMLISGTKTVYYSNYILNEKAPANLSLMGQVTESDDVTHSEEWWKENRPDSLSNIEIQTYKIAKQISESNAWRFVRKVGDLVGSGYLNFDYVAIGPIYEIYSRNDIEGDRLKIGIRTGDSLSTRFIAEGSLAYGFLDKRLKWQAYASFHINKHKRPWRLLGVMGRQGVEQIGLNPGQFRPDNLIGTFLRRRSLKTLSYINQIQLVYDHSWTETGSFSQKITVDWQQVFPTAVLPFATLNSYGVIAGNLPSYKRFEIRVETTFALDQINVGKRRNRISIPGVWPEIKFIYAMGIKGIFGSDFNYHLLRLNVKGRVKTPPIGRGEYTFSCGKIFGQVPYPILEIHPGNDTYSYDKYAFNCMNYFEFVSDQFMSFSYEHHFDGFFFNKIPWINKMNLKEIVGIRGVWGSLSEKNRTFMALPSGTQDLRDPITGKYIPYMEFNVGIENILKIVRLDFVYRLTHRKQTDPANPGQLLYAQSFNWGIFATFAFNL